MAHELPEWSVTVLIASSDGWWRSNLRKTLSERPWAEVVGEAPGPRHAFAPALEAMPDVVVMEMKPPTKEAILATGCIVRALPPTRVLVVTRPHVRGDRLGAAIKFGAYDHVEENESVGKIADAILRVSRVKPLMWPMERLARKEYGALPDTQTELPLTQPERGVLRLVAQGYGYQAIGWQLPIDRGTLQQLLRNIRIKRKLEDPREASFEAEPRGTGVV